MLLLFKFKTTKTRATYPIQINGRVGNTPGIGGDRNSRGLTFISISAGHNLQGKAGAISVCITSHMPRVIPEGIHVQGASIGSIEITTSHSDSCSGDSWCLSYVALYVKLDVDLAKNSQVKTLHVAALQIQNNKDTGHLPHSDKW